ncbi:MAG: endolytic transglycosylase MltG [Alphaproteobacteria bacterium]|nr:endolytic transglycosylase MltG [Alphaproteobacteria bacterium]
MADGKKKKLSAGQFVLGLLVYSSTIAVLLAGLAFWWGSMQFTKDGLAEEPTLFVVERGHGANRIAGELYREGLIEDPFIFMIGTTVMGQHTFLKAGEYEIQPRMSAYEIMQMMADGKTVGRRVTVREGLTSFEVIRLLNETENMSGEITDIPPEGILLPNTYDFQKDEPRSAIIERMEEEMEKVLLPVCQILLEKQPGSTLSDFLDSDCPPAPEPLKTVGDVLTLASIVEKETAVAAERRTVAGVFMNRLRRGIALQTDPTVIYALNGGKHKDDGMGPLGRRLLRKDMDVDSPYNTYKYPGLPPGPIANPGEASIRAVLDPEEHDYVYFVADGTGGHVFSKTLSEHNANVAKWRKIRRAQQ